VIIHAGYAIETLALEEAEQRLALFRRLAELGQGD
jgi:hydrogenase maturation factor